DRFVPALGTPGARPIAVLVLWLDPIRLSLVDPNRNRVSFNPQDNSYQNTFRTGYASVTGNVELLVLPFVASTASSYLLTVNQVAATARGGVAYFGPEGNTLLPLTAALRAGETVFPLLFGTVVALQAPVTSGPAQATASDASTSGALSAVAGQLAVSVRERT